MNENIYAMKKALQDYDIKPSYPRMKILEILQEKTHPSAEDIYQKLVGHIPTLSRTTVYNTLKLFQKQGMIQSLTIEEKETRFDVDTSTHGHFLCKQCGGVFDFSFQQQENQDLQDAGFHIQKQELYYRGLCPSCQKHS